MSNPELKYTDMSVGLVASELAVESGDQAMVTEHVVYEETWKK